MAKFKNNSVIINIWDAAQSDIAFEIMLLILKSKLEDGELGF